MQVAYRSRIRERYFGPDYEQEVRWVDGGGSALLASKEAAAGAGAGEAAKKEE